MQVFQNHADVNQTYIDRMIPWDSNTSIMSPRLTSLFLIGGGTTVSPTRIGSKENISPNGRTGSVEGMNAQPFNTSINGNSSDNGDPTPTFSKIIGQELSNNSSSDIYSGCQVNFTRDTIVTKILNFMNLGLSDDHTSDELGSFIIPATIIGRPTYGYNCLLPGHLIGKVAAARISGTRSKQNYNSKTDF